MLFFPLAGFINEAAAHIHAHLGTWCWKSTVIAFAEVLALTGLSYILPIGASSIPLHSVRLLPLHDLVTHLNFSGHIAWISGCILSWIVETLPNSHSMLIIS